MPKTLQEAAKTALEVQDACNLSGVLGAFTDIVMNTLWPIAHQPNSGKGTDWVNQHPICTMFLSKLQSLNGTDDSMLAYSHAYDAVTVLAEGKVAA